MVTRHNKSLETYKVIAPKGAILREVASEDSTSTDILPEGTIVKGLPTINGLFIETEDGKFITNSTFAIEQVYVAVQEEKKKSK